MQDKDLIKAVAYLRTSSAANVGADKDSERRQREAIEAFARSAGYEIVESYYDAAVSGADPVTTRPGFSAMLERLLSNGVRTILVETASRFARDLIVQETGHEMLKARGIELVAVDSPDSFVADTPTANLIRQVLGAVSEFEKAMLVEKLRGARERKRRETGRKVGGRKKLCRDRGWTGADHAGEETASLPGQRSAADTGRRCERAGRGGVSVERRHALHANRGEAHGGREGGQDAGAAQGRAR